ENLPDTPGQGFILLTSHVGNWQLALASLPMLNRKVHLLMRPEENEAVRAAIRGNIEDDQIRVISPEGALGGVVEMMRALQQGDIVSMMGDRTYGADGVTVDFLGEPASFPFSAFHLAAASGCPVVLLFSARTGPRRYVVDIPPVYRPAWSRGLAKREQARVWVQDYAKRLEAYLAEHPFQYFIFYDSWMESVQRSKVSPP
ncbi:MAG: lysophospholipid acyltransferase family protein, partial [Kiritimatiellia bacterium]|nr:lysophospholipid acyltransferase family protein [Kiritimatiellia bacterium]